MMDASYGALVAGGNIGVHSFGVPDGVDISGIQESEWVDTHSITAERLIDEWVYYTQDNGRVSQEGYNYITWDTLNTVNTLDAEQLSSMEPLTTLYRMDGIDLFGVDDNAELLTKVRTSNIVQTRAMRRLTGRPSIQYTYTTKKHQLNIADKRIVNLTEQALHHDYHEPTTINANVDAYLDRTEDLLGVDFKLN